MPYMDELAQFMGSYAEAWNRAELDARQLGRDAAMVTVRWVCRRPDDSTIWDFADSYLVALGQAGGASSVTWCTPRAHGPLRGFSRACGWSH
jgi:hypothetical protein